MDFNSSGNYRSDSIKFLINKKQRIKNVNKSNDEKDEREKNNLYSNIQYIPRIFFTDFIRKRCTTK